LPDTVFPCRAQLVVLSELESDRINPHDCAARLDKLVVRRTRVPRTSPPLTTVAPSHAAQMPELVLLGVQTGAYALTGRWLMALLNGGLLAWHAVRRGDRHTDVTEMFTRLPAEKRARLVRLAVYGAFLVLLVVRCGCRFVLGAAARVCVLR
jgi:hypothetical protein